jgi:hypothetical protein
MPNNEDMSATKRLMSALLRMKPKPHEEMKLRESKGKKNESPRRAKLKPK